MSGKGKGPKRRHVAADTQTCWETPPRHPRLCRCGNGAYGTERGFSLDANNTCAKRQQRENTYQRTRTPRSRHPLPPCTPPIPPQRTPPRRSPPPPPRPRLPRIAVIAFVVVFLLLDILFPPLLIDRRGGGGIPPARSADVGAAGRQRRPPPPRHTLPTPSRRPRRGDLRNPRPPHRCCRQRRRGGRGIPPTKERAAEEPLPGIRKRTPGAAVDDGGSRRRDGD